ncbi:MAG TPA: histidine phosphatase family protein [Gemmatimonadales bacterium]|nr:histidine phosphatase family protein [Gemmatimonadales bacterium]
MTTFLLIRHALCDPVGISIAGRTSGVHLNEAGRQQATALAGRLGGLPVAAIRSSPLERAMETAQPLAAALGLPVAQDAGLNEVDFGEWTGRTLIELDGLAEWRDFNERRSSTRIPGGETMAEVVSRSLATLEQVRRTPELTGRLVALVSHGDVLRSLVAHCIGMSPDALHRIEIAPASVSILLSEDGNWRLLLLNSTEEWPIR